MHNNTKTFCKAHTNIIILQADKGKSTVIIYKHDYDVKFKELDDKNTYKKLINDPTNVLQTKNNRFVIKLEKLHIINKVEKYQLTTYLSCTLYQKCTNLPYQCVLVIASINTPSSQTSKMLTKILTETMHFEKYNVKNSFIFKDRILSTTVTSTDMMVSFDIVSLFTNIPVSLAIDVVGEIGI